MPYKRLAALAAVLCLILAVLPAAADMPRTREIVVHCATVEEGQRLMRERDRFHEQINALSLDFLLQKKGGTLEEYIAYSAEQVLAFTPEDIARVEDCTAWLRDLLERRGLSLPDPGTVTVVKTTGLEAMGAAGYTCGSTIFLAASLFDPGMETAFRRTLLHELSHCLSRAFPEYREALYGLIGFRVLEEEIDLPEEVLERIIANPDVERHDNAAFFTVDGKRTECCLVFLTDSVFERAGDDFFSGMYVGVVPLDTFEVHRVEEIPDFWDQVGRNTTYVEDPEEAMATNFSYALLYLDAGYAFLPSPEIPEGIIGILGR